ncbi:MAG: glycosyltransferase family 2 protein [Planctomycetota bacterium]
MTIELSVILVTYRSAPEIGACVRSLRTAGYLTDPNVEVLIVDNNSDDDTLALARRHAPEVRRIARRENSGFAVACNEGAQRARGHALLFLNPDTEVEPGSLELLLQRLWSHPDIGAVGPRLRGRDGSIAPEARPLPTPLGEFARKWSRAASLLGIRAAPRVRAPDGDVEWLCGACLMVRRSTWNEVGPFDPAFFLYFEETDWCLRAARHNWRLVLEHRAAIKHTAGASAARAGQRLRGGEVLRHLVASRRTYFRKHFGYLASLVVEALHRSRHTYELLCGGTR